jgi:hypothetical protein
MALTKAHSRMIAGSYINALDYGAVGDGVTDDTAALQAAITAASGSSLVIPDGNYLVSSTITLSGCTIFGYGAKITSTVSAGVTFSGSVSNIKIYGLEIQGLGNSSYVSSETLVEINGTGNGALAPTFIKGIEIKDCHIHSVGRAAVRVRYLENSNFCNNIIENVGRSGIESASVKFCRFDGNIVRNMSPGDGSNAYGIFVSRQKKALISDPISEHCTVNNNIIENNTIWEALDTHGGQYITFANNTIKNCKIGIVLVNSEDETGTQIGCAFCSITGNVMKGTNRSGFNGSYGLNIAGSSDETTRHCTIVGNVIDQFGNQASTTNAAIRLSYLNNVTVSGNTVKRAGANCIIINTDCENVTIVGNSLQDSWSDDFVARGIFVNSGNNTGYIGNNTISRVTTSLGSSVMARGIDFGSGSSNAFILGPNRNTATTPYANSSNGTINVPTVLTGSSTATVSTGAASHTFAVTFPQAFSTAPSVVASTGRLGTGTNSVAVVSVSNITTTGCDIVVATSDRNNFGSAYSVTVEYNATGF